MSSDSDSREPPQALNDPYSLSHLLPLGVLILTLDSINAPFSHSPCADGWHNLDALLLMQRLDNPDDERICRGLEFLVNHKFISSLFCIIGHTALLRVYLIPYDLPGVQGRLRVRKDDILSPAARYLKMLLPRVIQDQKLWNGHPSNMPFYGPYLFCDKHDARTLSEIYGDIASPRPTPWPGCDPLVNRLLSYHDQLSDFGMRSILFKYQRQTVAAMLQKELDNRDIEDPLFVPITGMDGTVFYLQPAKMEILRERPLVSAPRGGILCEELGTGKTIMVLSLIIATLDQLSAPESSILDAHRPVLTPLSFRHFPSAECYAARKRVRAKRNNSGVPSLVELLLHRTRAHPYQMQRYQERLEATRLQTLHRANTPFYHHFEQSLIDLDRKKRKQSPPGPAMIFLTTATLIVVPANLMGQWSREIIKHCDIDLRVLVLRKKDKIPPATSLANDYDIILLSYDKLSDEASRSDISKRQSWHICTCTEYSNARVPQCMCEEDTTLSPLLRVRWKRLVIDEGHVSGAIRNNLTYFAKLLSVERKWVVTGTPTTHLLGLNFGGNGVSNEELVESSESCDQGSPPPPDFSQPRRIWTRYDAQDLNKLGTMMTHFMSVPIFRSDPKRFYAYVSDALLDCDGPRLGAVQVLTQVMEMVMIRHRIEDVELDIALPPVKHTTVMLDLDPYASKSYNALQSIIAINAVDSERRDQDYLFHPNNTAHLAALVRNISQVLFHGVDDNLYNVDEICRVRDELLSRAIERNVSPEDVQLLKDALKHIEMAASDKTWRGIQAHEDVPYRIYHLDQDIFQAWSYRIPQTGEVSVESSDYAGLLHCDLLFRMYDVVRKRPLVSKTGLIELAEEARKEGIAIREAISSKPSAKRKRSEDISDNSSSKSSQLAAAKSHTNREKVQEVRRELQVALTQQEALESDEGERVVDSPESSLAVDSNTAKNADTTALLSCSLLNAARIGSSVSSKLNFILDQVQIFSAEEKFLIFSDSPLTLAHVAEGLELMRVKYLRFSSQIETRTREEFVMTFETSETYRVFLMDLKHGSRGLNLISASRIIFCEPVWRADVESQAIKRAHRIGQSRAITVHTLAIRGTHEETIPSRREAMKGRQDNIPSMANESGMRQFIANPKFLKPSLSQPVPMMNIALAPSSWMPLSTADTDETMSESVNVLGQDQETVEMLSIIPPSLVRRRIVIALDPVVDAARASSPEATFSPPKRRRVVSFLD